MNAKAAVVTVLGAVVALLGAVWLVQGLGIVEMDPILCAADCEPITGRSARWAGIGAISLVAGIAIVRTGLGRVR